MFLEKTNQFAIYIVTVFMRDSKIGSTNSILFERVNKLGCGNENAGILWRTTKGSPKLIDACSRLNDKEVSLQATSGPIIISQLQQHFGSHFFSALWGPPVSVWKQVDGVLTHAGAVDPVSEDVKPVEDDKSTTPEALCGWWWREKSGTGAVPCPRRRHLKLSCSINWPHAGSGRIGHGTSDLELSGRQDWERQLHAAPGMRVLELTTSSTPRGEEATLSCRCPRHGSAAGGPWCEMAASLRGNSEEREEGTAGVARRRRWQSTFGHRHGAALPGHHSLLTTSVPQQFPAVPILLPAAVGHPDWDPRTVDRAVTLLTIQPSEAYPTVHILPFSCSFLPYEPGDS
jgi:hypothetical protein